MRSRISFSTSMRMCSRRPAFSGLVGIRKSRGPSLLAAVTARAGAAATAAARAADGLLTRSLLDDLARRPRLDCRGLLAVIVAGEDVRERARLGRLPLLLGPRLALGAGLASRETVSERPH